MSLVTRLIPISAPGPDDPTSTVVPLPSVGGAGSGSGFPQDPRWSLVLGRAPAQARAQDLPQGDLRQPWERRWSPVRVRVPVPARPWALPLQRRESRGLPAPLACALVLAAHNLVPTFTNRCRTRKGEFFDQRIRTKFFTNRVWVICCNQVYHTFRHAGFYQYLKHSDRR